LAITNCLNFANPQRPEIMAQIVGCLEGMAAACQVLDYPIVSGNVSLYNESKATGGGSAILPTPAIGGVGLMADYGRMATIGFKAAGEAIYLMGQEPWAGPHAEHGHLGQSLWLREIHGREDGDAPHVDLTLEKHSGEFVRELIEAGWSARCTTCPTAAWPSRWPRWRSPAGSAPRSRRTRGSRSPAGGSARSRAATC
jgi:phosphoribosylformylglycinamidine synthase